MNTELRNDNTFKVAKRALVDLEETFGWLAREVGITETYLRQILKNTVRGAKYKPVISEKLGLSIETLWPPTEAEKAAQEAKEKVLSGGGVG